jgi:dolichyl-phosphate-mannose--protein O-mannosyl transferase
MLSLSSFSQIDTTKTALPNNILRLVAKDLVRYDGCKEELKLTKLKVEKLEGREVQKDTIISLYKEKDENNKYIIKKLELQVGQYENLTKDLHKELKGQKVKSFFWKAGTFLGVITTSFLLLK